MHGTQAGGGAGVLALVLTTQSGSWTAEDAREYAARLNDPERWYAEKLESDVSGFHLESALESSLPILDSPFPIVEYVSVGNGCFLHDVDVAGRAMTAVLPKAPRPEDLWLDLETAKSGNFPLVTTATILVHTGGRSIERPFFVTSRNHPTYFAEGAFLGERLRIDWLVLRLPDGNGHAVVNTRVFDLRAGTVLLVNPMADGSLRFLQLEDEGGESDPKERLIALGDRDDVDEFLHQPGSLYEEDE